VALSGQTAPPWELPESGGGRVLRTDVRVALLLLNDARYRTMGRVFGLSREQADLATLVLSVTLAAHLHEQVGRLSKGPTPPTYTEVMWTNASIGALMRAIAGPAADKTPLFATLVALALLGHPTRRALAGSLRGVRSSSRRMAGGFHHRYGYLIDPGHRRLRRAQQQLVLLRERASRAAGEAESTPETVTSQTQ
jgi:hypothetical protein